ncbi:MAG: mycofactocin biosynthesis peptidyl-dipeptidase MftE, partial [Acidimicrobiales bacterium]
MDLAGATWPEVAATDRRHVLAVPLGSLEQHGPHLPLDTDTRIALALATRLAAARPAVAVGPALPYGASGEHAGFPGTLVVAHDVVAALVVELVRSARASFAGVVVVSAHGGNGEGLARAEQRCRAEGDALLVWSAVPGGGDAHAGRTETSLVLALAPSLVRVGQAAAGETAPLARLMATLRHGGVAAVSQNGVLGDPKGASAAEGVA